MEEAWSQKWLLSNNYLVYYRTNFLYSKYGNIATSNSYFQQKYLKAVARLKSQSRDSAIQNFQANLQASSENATQIMAMFDNYQLGEALNEIYDGLGQIFNQQVTKVENSLGGGESLVDTYRELISKKNTYNTMLTDMVEGKTERLQSFFDDVMKAIALCSQYDGTTIEALTNLMTTANEKYGAKLDIDSFKNKWGIYKVDINEDTKNAASNIVRYLENAFNKLEAGNGTYSGFGNGTKNDAIESFTSTVNNIFSTAGGEGIAGVLYANTMLKGASEIQSYLDKMQQLLQKAVNSNENVKVEVEFDENFSTNLTGTQTAKKDGVRSRAKSDLVASDLFKITLNFPNDESITIGMDANISVKWYKKDITAAGNISVVSGSPLKKYFTDGFEKFYGYNIIQHRRDLDDETIHEAYRNVRAATAASFFNDWISGSGGIISGSGSLDSVQYLMVNGTLYSINTILAKICESINNDNLGADSESADMPFNMSVQLLTRPEWVGDKSIKDLTKALDRSKKANEVMNQLQVTGKLNNKIILDIAKNL